MKTNNFTLIGRTKDGKPCYWGKKDSGDPQSRDMTLWITVGKPLESGDNYRRVPPAAEIIYFEKASEGMDAWNKHIQNLIENSSAAELKKWQKSS